MNCKLMRKFTALLLAFFHGVCYDAGNGLGRQRCGAQCEAR